MCLPAGASEPSLTIRLFIFPWRAYKSYSQHVSQKFPRHKHFVIAYGYENIADNDDRTLCLIYSQPEQPVKERFFGFV